MTETPFPARRLSAAGVVRWLAVVAVAGVVGTMISLPAAPPAAAAEADSSVTVKWRGGNAPEIEQHQVDHEALLTDENGNDNGSGHWNDFKDLQVSVSQTKGLIDQSVRVTASGMAQTQVESGGGVKNFLQVFQCWGDDPDDPGFVKTCQWGGFSVGEVGGSPQGSVGQLFGNFSAYDLGRAGHKFRSVVGTENTPQPIPGTPPGSPPSYTAGLNEFFTASTSNELPLVPISADGTASANFAAQSAASQPYLGCGDAEAAGERCWLVVVPRGIHSGALGDGTSCQEGGGSSDTVRGKVTFAQTGSPISSMCSFWDDRIVVPLDFADPYLSCPPGSAERRVVGSELFAEAMSSWQPKLCAGGAYSLTTNSGDLARAQLLSGQVDFAAVSEPLTAETIGGADPALLAEADLRYAPLANTALVIAFVLDQRDGTIATEVKLTPRLLAKLLTQSYQNDVPQLGGDWGSTTIGASREFLTVGTVIEDPEWIALGNARDLSPSTARAVWSVFGPQGDDAIRLLWEYVLADADAVAFLQGEPDPWGATINRYYLPPSHEKAAGGGTDLLTAPLDNFPKADQSVVPGKEEALAKYRGLQLDSTAYSPYSGSFVANAARIARVDSGLTLDWDPSIYISANENGNWMKPTPVLPGSPVGRVILGPVTASAAGLYQVNSAQLARPLATKTTKETVSSAREFVAHTDATVAAGIQAQLPVAGGVAVTDMAAVPSGAYPLSTTVYAAVNAQAGALQQDAREDYAALVEYAGGEGNVRSGARGGLPEGYVPLTDAQVAAGSQLAAVLRTPAEPEADPAAEAPPAGSGPGSSGGASAPVPAPAADNAPQTDYAAAPALTAESTAATATPGQGALGGTLLAAIAGLIASPLLLRRRGTAA